MDGIFDMIMNEFVARYNEEIVLALLVIGVMIVPSLLLILLSIVAIITVPPIFIIYWLCRFLFWLGKKAVEMVRGF